MEQMMAAALPLSPPQRRQERRQGSAHMLEFFSIVRPYLLSSVDMRSLAIALHAPHIPPVPAAYIQCTCLASTAASAAEKIGIKQRVMRMVCAGHIGCLKKELASKTLCSYWMWWDELAFCIGQAGDTALIEQMHAEVTSRDMDDDCFRTHLAYGCAYGNHVALTKQYACGAVDVVKLMRMAIRGHATDTVTALLQKYNSVLSPRAVDFWLDAIHDGSVAVARIFQDNLSSRCLTTNFEAAWRQAWASNRRDMLEYVHDHYDGRLPNVISWAVVFENDAEVSLQYIQEKHDKETQVHLDIYDMVMADAERCLQYVMDTYGILSFQHVDEMHLYADIMNSPRPPIKVLQRLLYYGDEVFRRMTHDAEAMFLKCRQLLSLVVQNFGVESCARYILRYLASLVTCFSPTWLHVLEPTWNELVRLSIWRYDYIIFDAALHLGIAAGTAWHLRPASVKYITGAAQTFHNRLQRYRDARQPTQPQAATEERENARKRVHT